VEIHNISVRHIPSKPVFGANLQLKPPFQRISWRLMKLSSHNFKLFGQIVEFEDKRGMTRVMWPFLKFLKCLGSTPPGKITTPPLTQPWNVSGVTFWPQLTKKVDDMWRGADSFHTSYGLLALFEFSDGLPAGDCWQQLWHNVYWVFIGFLFFGGWGRRRSPFPEPVSHLGGDTLFQTPIAQHLRHLGRPTSAAEILQIAPCKRVSFS